MSSSSFILQMSCLLLLIVFVLLPSCSGNEATDKYHYEFNVKREYKNIDGYMDKTVVTINGEFNGPTIDVPAGSIVHVVVVNHMGAESLSIHWHGLLLANGDDLYNDGVPHATQCPVSPGESFEYLFNVTKDDIGTHWYHSHVSTQRSDGLFGAFIVREVGDTGHGGGKIRDLHYDAELPPLLIGDLWHKTAVDLSVGLKSVPFRWVGDPQSITINGHGAWESCSDSKDCGPIKRFQLDVEYGQKYLLRLINIASVEYFRFFIYKHRFTIVSADSGAIEPLLSSFIDFSSGQRYDVILEADQAVSNYWAIPLIRYRPDVAGGEAILHYHGAPDTSRMRNQSFVDHKRYQVEIDDPYNSVHLEDKMKGVISDSDILKSVNRTEILAFRQIKTDSGRLFWPINDVVHEFPSTPLAFTAAFEDTHRLTEPQSMLRIIEAGTVMQLVLQNEASYEGMCDMHPFHLHGHHFQVVGRGRGRYSNESTLQFLDAPLSRDTLTVYPDIPKKPGALKENEPCGWTAIRFRARTGVWLFHCHIDAHVDIGMAMVFHVGDVPSPPPHLCRCGDYNHSHCNVDAHCEVGSGGDMCRWKKNMESWKSAFIDYKKHYPLKEISISSIT